MNKVFEKIKATAPLFGMLAALGGFIADVLQPILPFISYIFYASALAFAAIVIALVIKASLRSTAIEAMVFSFAMMAVSGVIYFYQTKESAHSGVLAHSISAIGDFQVALGLIDQKLSDIKESTQRIEKTTERTAKKLDAVGQDTKALAANTKRIADSIELTLNELLKSGGIIKHPNSPQEFYANARMYELQGDSANARRSYVKFIQFDVDYLDPHLQYQTFLKVQNGLEGAREMYLERTQASTSLSAKFARTLLFSRKIRIKKMTYFLAKHAEFGPAYLMLSKEYSEARLGEQTAGDKLKERKYLKQFIEQFEEGNVVKYFLDKTIVSEWLETSKSTIAKLALLNEKALKQPISIYMMHTNAAWMIQVISMDKISELFYQWEGSQEGFTSTGFSSVIDTSTGNPMPNFTIQAPLSLQKKSIYFKYKDLKGQMHGPFSIAIDPDKEREQSAKRILESTTQNWISSRLFDGKSLFYFTHLQQYSCAIEKAVYAYDNDLDLKQTLPLQACGHSKQQTALLSLQAPEDTSYMAVQLFYKDHTTSKVHKFMMKGFPKGVPIEQ